MTIMAKDPYNQPQIVETYDFVVVVIEGKGEWSHGKITPLPPMQSPPYKLLKYSYKLPPVATTKGTKGEFTRFTELYMILAFLEISVA